MPADGTKMRGAYVKDVQESGTPEIREYRGPDRFFRCSLLSKSEERLSTNFSSLHPTVTDHFRNRISPTSVKLLIQRTILFLLVVLPLGAQTGKYPSSPAPRKAVGRPPVLTTSRTDLQLKVYSCSPVRFTDDTLTVFNTGDEPVELEAILPDPRFQIIDPSPARFTLAPGEGRKVTIRYIPGTEDQISVSLALQPIQPALRDLTQSVSLFGSQSRTQLVPSVRSIRFDTLLSCQNFTRKTFDLRNDGPTPVTINDPMSVQSPFIVNITSPLPVTIPPGKSEQVEVTFKTFENGTFSAYLYYKSSPCDVLDSILLHGTQMTPSYEVGGADFGEVTVGGSGTADVAVTNTGIRRIRIVGAQIVPPTPEITIAPTQFPIRIPAGESGNVQLRFTPSALGNLPDGITLRIKIDSLCDTTLTTGVKGTGIRGGISLNRTGFDFGDVIFCETADDTLTLRNAGGAPITLSAPALDPPGMGAYFTIVDGAAAPGTLQPGSTHRIIVRFSPGPGPDVPENAVLRMASTDPLRPELEIPVTGKRVSQSLVLEGAGFAPVIRGLSGLSTRRLVNTGTAPVPVTALPILLPFSVLRTEPALPAVLAPGDTLLIELMFAPTSAGAYADSLRVTALTPCATFSFEITGIAQELIPVGLRWGTAAGKPGERVRIPLFLDNDATGAAVTSFTASAAFNGSLLVPKAIVTGNALPAGWSITGQQIMPASVIFTASGPTPLGLPGELVYLEAVVMLGDSLRTTIRPGDSLALYSPRASASASSGLFTLEGYCDVGGGRLVRADGSFGLKGVRPNPIRSDAEIEFETVEDGPVSVTLYDALGERSAVLLEAPLPARTHLLRLDASALPSGFYVLKIRTATAVERMKLVVRK